MVIEIRAVLWAIRVTSEGFGWLWTELLAKSWRYSLEIGARKGR